MKSVVGIRVKESQFTGPEFNFDYAQQLIKTVNASRGASLRGGVVKDGLHVKNNIICDKYNCI